MARRILLVEDDDLLRGSLSLLLEEEGYQVTAAESAARALEAASDCAFDLVITDVRMPGMSGISMLRQMRQTAPETRAVVITGFADFETPVEAFRLQVDDFLTKPFDEETFLKAVGRALEWLDRQAWWRASQERSYRDSLALWEWSLLSLAPEREAALRRRELARRVGSLSGLQGEELEALSWAALLTAVAGGATLLQGLERCRELLSQDPADRQGWEHRSTLKLAERALQLTEAEPILAAVARYDALAHPADASLGLSRQECLQMLEAPPELRERLEQALSGGTVESPAGEPPSGAAGLALTYLAAGQPELARQTLEAIPNPSALARLCLGTARLACGDAAGAIEQARLALERVGSRLARADILALLGTARLAVGEVASGEADLEQATRLYEGAARGAVRVRLLRAWGYQLAGSKQAPSAVQELLDKAEGLEWALSRERWLTQRVLGASGSPRAAEMLARLRLCPPAEPPAALEVEGLGPLRIRFQGREIKEQDWKTSKSRALFLVLLLHGGTEVPDERLTDLFWSELEGDRAQANLYSALTYIRRALGEGDLVQHRRGRCRFNTDLSHRVDFLDFEREVKAGRLQQALDLYRGDLLENLQEDWIRPYRRRLRELAVRALEGLLAEAAGKDDRLLSLAEQLLSVDRCHQGAYQELMRLWGRAGQPERVARLYWACQEALAEELQLAPSAETTRLFQELTAQSRISQGSSQ
ncbi:MAG: hypothetical protein AMXMBFR33_15660 [Candidatus Xenobia bacterium]